MSNPAKNCDIHHPKANVGVHSTSFVAFGRVDNDADLNGTVTGPDGKPVPHIRVKQRTSQQDNTRTFWSMRFKVQAEGQYILNVRDGTTPIGEPVTFQVAASFRDVVITYPQAANGDNPVPYEFEAYGTAAAGNVSGTMSNCATSPPTDIEQDDPGADWDLYCFIVNPIQHAPYCTLTVSQAGSTSGTSAGLQIGG